MTGERSLKVQIKGIQYWLLSGDLEVEGAIAPMHHCDIDGNILPEYVFAESYAHWFPSVGVMRYGSVISTTLEAAQ